MLKTLSSYGCSSNPVLMTPHGFICYPRKFTDIFVKSQVFSCFAGLKFPCVNTTFAVVVTLSAMSTTSLLRSSSNFLFLLVTSLAFQVRRPCCTLLSSLQLDAGQQIRSNPPRVRVRLPNVLINCFSREFSWWCKHHRRCSCYTERNVNDLLSEEFLQFPLPARHVVGISSQASL